MSTPYTVRRHNFVDSLYRLGYGLDSANAAVASRSRRVLAELRRSMTGGRYQYDAYQYLVDHDPPESEQDAWLLVASLFALHPAACPASNRATLATAMGRLARQRGPAVTRRFTQLLGQDATTLSHHLRQCVRLLATGSTAVNYETLLDDLVVLTNSRSDPDEAHRVRLRWTRDYHKATRAGVTGASLDQLSTKSEPSVAPDTSGAEEVLGTSSASINPTSTVPTETRP